MGPDGPKGPRLVRLASIPAKELCSPDYPRPAPAPPRRGHNTVDLSLASPRPALGRRRRRSPSRRSQTAFCFLPSTEPCGGLEPEGGAGASRALAIPPPPPPRTAFCPLRVLCVQQKLFRLSDPRAQVRDGLPACALTVATAVGAVVDGMPCRETAMVGQSEQGTAGVKRGHRAEPTFKPFFLRSCTAVSISEGYFSYSLFLLRVEIPNNDCKCWCLGIIV